MRFLRGNKKTHETESKSLLFFMKWNAYTYLDPAVSLGTILIFTSSSAGMESGMLSGSKSLFLGSISCSSGI